MKKRYSEEQIITAIKEHEAGAKVDDICRRLGISSGTFYNWRSKYAYQWLARSHTSNRPEWILSKVPLHIFDRDWV